MRVWRESMASSGNLPKVETAEGNISMSFRAKSSYTTHGSYHGSPLIKPLTGPVTLCYLDDIPRQQVVWIDRIGQPRHLELMSSHVFKDLSLGSPL